MEDTVVVNIDFPGGNSESIQNMLAFNYDISWLDFELMLKLNFECEDIQIKYMDEDNDEVTISSQEELGEAFKIAKKCGNTLQLKIYSAKTTTDVDIVFEDAVQATADISNQTVSMTTKKNKSEEKDAAAETTPSAKTPDEDVTMSSEQPAPKIPSAPFEVQSNEETGEAAAVAEAVSSPPRLPPLCMTEGSSRRLRGVHGESCERKGRKQKIKGGYYAKLARDIGRLHKEDHLKAYQSSVRPMQTVPSFCDESGEVSQDPPHVTHPGLLAVLPGGQTTCRTPAVVTRDGTAASCVGDDEVPPAWFKNYMAKYKQEIAGEIANLVSQRTVRQILDGLQGAVIHSVRGTSGLPIEPSPEPMNTDSASANNTLYWHEGVYCDHCEQSIVGVRYKCGNCEDYDLCEQCEARGDAHNPDHVFVKIRRPALSAGYKRNGKRTPLLKKSLYAMEEEEEDGAPEEDAKMVPIVKWEKKYHEKIIKKQEKLRRKEEKLEEKLKRKEEKLEEKFRRKEEKLKRRLDQQKELPHKKEKLDLPQFKTTERMEAQFIRDENIPDGTHVQPGTKLVKRWAMKNTGNHVWTSGTKLEMIWGNMKPVKSQVSVPYLLPGQEGVVTVELMAPEEPGYYQCHWRLNHHGFRFGHRIWCSIIVDEKEVLEPSVEGAGMLAVQRETDEPQQKVDEENNIAVVESPDVKADAEPEMCVGSTAVADVQIQTAASQGQTSKTEVQNSKDTAPVVASATGVLEGNILTAQDILTFEMLDIRDRSAPRMSQTATPNNTPLDVTPPKSPAPELEDFGNQLHQLSNSSSVEIVSESPEDNAALMTELVQERMASLGLRPDNDLVDIESLSSFSDDSNDTDSDFYIVPLPDCFNPNLPINKSVSSCSDSRKSEESLNSERTVISVITQTESEPDVIMLDGSDQELTEAQTPGNKENTDVAQVSAESQEQQNREAEVQKTPEPSAPEPTTQSVSQPEEGTTAENCSVPEGATSQPEARQDVQPVAAGEGTDAQPPNSPTELASNLVTAAFDAASHVAVSAYTTAKDVFHTLQARNQYVPPKSDWKPSDQKWTPPKRDWTPPESTWTPPKADWKPPEDWQPSEPRTEMDHLIEMGFANRELNASLLKKHNNNVEKVIQELLQESENDWHNARH